MIFLRFTLSSRLFREGVFRAKVASLLGTLCFFLFFTMGKGKSGDRAKATRNLQAVQEKDRPGKEKQRV